MNVVASLLQRYEASLMRHSLIKRIHKISHKIVKDRGCSSDIGSLCSGMKSMVKTIEWNKLNDISFRFKSILKKVCQSIKEDKAGIVDNRVEIEKLIRNAHGLIRDEYTSISTVTKKR